MDLRLAPLAEMLAGFGARAGVVADATTRAVRVLAAGPPVLEGDLLLVRSERGGLRVDLLQVAEARLALRRPDDPLDLARARIDMPDAWSADELGDGPLAELLCVPLLGAVPRAGGLEARAPRRLPDPFADVFRVVPGGGEERVLRDLLRAETAGDLLVGHLRAGEEALTSIDVRIPVEALAAHVAILGRTGSGKSHATQVLLAAARAHCESVERGEGGRALSMLVLDPHDEYGRWRGDGSFRLSRADVTPADLAAVADLHDLALAFAEETFLLHGELWIDHLRRSAPHTAQESEPALFAPRKPRRGESAVAFHEETVAAVQRRLAFLGDERSKLFAPVDAEGVRSDLVALLAALESGSVRAIDTSLFGEQEQWLLATVVARTLFTLRRAVRAATSAAGFEETLDVAFRRQRSLRESLREAVAAGRLPYLRAGRLTSIDELPIVALVVEEAPALLGRDRLRPGATFRDLSRQGRKFGLGLVVVSQQVRALDPTVLAQTNAELILSLGSEEERRAALELASAEVAGGTAALRPLARGEGFFCAVGRRLALPVLVPPLPLP